MTTKRMSFFSLACISIGLAIGLLARQPIWELIRGSAETKRPELKLPSKVVPKPSEIAKPHLTWADQESVRIIDEHIKALDYFFSEAKRNTPAFAESAMSLSSKYNLIKDYVPFSQGGQHEKYIRDQFEKILFSPPTIEQILRQVVESYLQELKSIEGRMLVRIRADISEFPDDYPISLSDTSKIQKLYGEAIQTSITSSKVDLQSMASRELASFVIGEVLAQVAIQLGTSAGILTAGGASSTVTLGVGFAVGIILDVIVS